MRYQWPSLADVVDRDQLYQLSADLKLLADTMVPSAARLTPTTPSAELVKSIIRSRRMREQYLGSGLFADPAWDMLLDLFAARLEGRRVSVSSLCLAAAVPPTAALRRIAMLEEKALVVRRSDSRDRRRVWMEVQNETATKIYEFLRVAGTAAPLLV